MESRPQLGVCILAGGISQRMGRDKAGLRLGGRTLLGHIRSTAASAGLVSRVIRHDLAPGCGPLGGIYTGLKTSAAEAELFLSCDMPFVTGELLLEIGREHERDRRAIFLEGNGLVGFPLLVACASLGEIERQIDSGALSLQELAHRLEARVWPAGSHQDELFNVNTPEDWAIARQHWRAKRLL